MVSDYQFSIAIFKKLKDFHLNILKLNLVLTSLLILLQKNDNKCSDGKNQKDQKSIEIPKTRLPRSRLTGRSLTLKLRIKVHVDHAGPSLLPRPQKALMLFKQERRSNLPHSNSLIVPNKAILMVVMEAGWMMSLITFKTTMFAQNQNILIKQETKNAMKRNAL